MIPDTGFDAASRLADSGWAAMLGFHQRSPTRRRDEASGVSRRGTARLQRGNDRQACFFEAADYLCYLQALREAALRHACQVHAYVLMTNHVHLLLTSVDAGAVAKAMQAVGRRYVRHVNDSTGRTGTLWEGRYKASLVDSERYVLACYRYIELNPVRAGMVASPAAYRWSSFAANGNGLHDPLVTPHAVYQQIAATTELRCARYRDLVAETLADEDLAAIRLYAQRQRALGTPRFQAQIEQQLKRRAGIGQPGRPRKEKVL
jgi:putative transposase